MYHVQVNPREIGSAYGIRSPTFMAVHPSAWRPANSTVERAGCSPQFTTGHPCWCQRWCQVATSLRYLQRETADKLVAQEGTAVRAGAWVQRAGQLPSLPCAGGSSVSRVSRADECQIVTGATYFRHSLLLRCGGWLMCERARRPTRPPAACGRWVRAAWRGARRRRQGRFHSAFARNHRRTRTPSGSRTHRSGTVWCGQCTAWRCGY
jgi:hypothetical protein